MICPAALLGGWQLHHGTVLKGDVRNGEEKRGVTDDVCKQGRQQTVNRCRDISLAMSDTQVIVLAEFFHHHNRDRLKPLFVEKIMGFVVIDTGLEKQTCNTLCVQRQ